MKWVIPGDKLPIEPPFTIDEKVDRLISQKRKLENIGDNKKQWYRDRMRYLDKNIKTES